MPVEASTFAEALDWAAEVYRAAGARMAKAGRLQGVADEGGYWPAFDTNEEALEFLVLAIEDSGRSPGHDLAISLDVAASEFHEAAADTASVSTVAPSTAMGSSSCCWGG